MDDNCLFFFYFDSLLKEEKKNLTDVTWNSKKTKTAIPTVFIF